MALPVNSAPTYTLTIPSTGESVKYRPFLVKEEKALLIAQHSEDQSTMLETLKSIIASCILDKIDVDSLATFDIEYIFAQIRAKSVGEVIELIFRCDTCDDEKAKVKVSIDLTKIEVKKDPEHKNDIPLFGSVGIRLKYPDISVVDKIRNVDENDMDKVFDVIIQCIDFIYDDEQIYAAKEQSKKELLEFLDNLTSEQFMAIQKFFETMPKMRQEIDFTCPVCGKEHHKYLEGINSFF